MKLLRVGPGPRHPALIATLVALAIGLLAASTSGDKGEIRGSRFVLVDREGRTLVELRADPDGAVALRLSDRSGVTRVALGVSGDGSTRLGFSGADGKSSSCSTGRAASCGKPPE